MLNGSEIMNHLKRDLQFVTICEMIEDETMGNPEDLGIHDLSADFDICQEQRRLALDRSRDLTVEIDIDIDVSDLVEIEFDTMWEQQLKKG